MSVADKGGSHARREDGNLRQVQQEDGQRTLHKSKASPPRCRASAGAGSTSSANMHALPFAHSPTPASLAWSVTHGRSGRFQSHRDGSGYPGLTTNIGAKASQFKCIIGGVKTLARYVLV